MLTQPITLVTGTPGAGKTLRSIFEGLQLQKDGREVFAYGIDGLDPAFIESLPDTWSLEKWKELPPNSVLIVDEAHKFLPVRQPGKPPQWIQDLTEIRHHGITLILVTQDPRNIDAFVRRLVGEHVHLTRKAGLAGSLVRTFQGVSEDPNDYHARQSSQAVPWVFPKELYKVYKSASLHVMKPKIPWKIWAAGAFVVVLIFLIPYIYFKFGDTIDETPPTMAEKALNSQKSAFAGDEEESPWSSPDAFVKAHKPHFPVAPWSAPIFKNLVPTTVPKILCIASGLENAQDRTCHCYTEQVTRIRDIPTPICEIIVRDGQYNPYLPPVGDIPATAAEGQSVDAPGGQMTIIPDDGKSLHTSGGREAQKSEPANET